MRVDDPAAAAQEDHLLRGDAAPTGPFQGLLTLARRSILVAIVIGLAAFAATGFALWQLRDYHVDTAARHLRHVAFGLSEQTSQEIREADQHLLRILALAQQQPETLEDAAYRQRIMARNVAAIAQVGAILYSGPDAEREVYVKPGAASAAAAFPAELPYTEGLSIVAVAAGEPPGLFLQRRVPRNNAKSGTLVMRLSADHLASIYRVWRGRSEVSVALLTPDRQPLLQYPHTLDLAISGGEGAASSPAPGAAGLRYRNAVDGRTYLVATEPVRGYGLFVRTATSEREALTEWTALAALLAGATFTLVMFLTLIARRHAAELERGAVAVGKLQSLRSALETEDAKLRAMFDTALRSIIVIDERGIIERVNPATERVFGYAAEELVGLNVSMLMPQHHAQRHDEYIERYLQTGISHIIGQDRELSARRKDGTEFPIQLSLAEQRFPGYRRFMGTIRDISREKLIDALLRAETRIASVLSSAETVDKVAEEVVGALCGLGFAYGHWVVWNPVARAWLALAQCFDPQIDAGKAGGLARGPHAPGPDGIASSAWSSGELAWRTHLEQWVGRPRAAAAVATGLNSCVAVPVRSSGEVVAVIELFCVRADPRNDMLESALRNIGVQVGQLLGRFHAEQQLRAIVKTVPSAVFQARVSQRRTVGLTYVSAQIERLWGVPAKVVLARPRQVLWKIAPAFRRDLLRALSRAVLRGSGWDVTVPIQSPEGLRWMRVHAAPAHQAGEAPVWDGIVSDVTEQKLAEQQIARLNLDLERRVEERTQELAELNRELEAFSASVSHDLRAPLRGIRSYAEMLREADADASPEIRMMIERIVSQGAQMEQLIEALLELSQITRRELLRSMTDMSVIPSTVLEELQRSDPERRVSWSVADGMRAYADPRLMRVLFENLLANAWKFTRDRTDARIDVGWIDHPRHAFFVRDNGAGFDPVYADKLFQPFQRLHPASQFEGTGIGLATVQRIVRRHGGRIWADSTPGEGATFYFELSMEGDANHLPPAPA